MSQDKAWRMTKRVFRELGIDEYKPTNEDNVIESAGMFIVRTDPSTDISYFDWDLLGPEYAEVGIFGENHNVINLDCLHNTMSSYAVMAPAREKYHPAGPLSGKVSGHVAGLVGSLLTERAS
ncbi:MAG: hypothetical protein AAB436_04500 [Patescibacteria group bacterium]